MSRPNHESTASTDTFDLTGPMTSTAHYLNEAGVGRALSPSNPTPQPAPYLQTNAWKRRSLPNTGVHREYVDRSDLDELLVLHAARKPNRVTDPTLQRNPSLTNSARGYREQLQLQLQLQEDRMGVARERVQRESPIIAELRTNVKDEFTLVTDLSRRLALRYARSDAAIMVKVDHSACIALGGSFDPCYIMTITNISSQMGPAMNKRNAALIQSYMSDVLSVPSDRGIIKFHAISEDDLAINGTTIRGEIDRQEKQQADMTDPGAVRQSASIPPRKSSSSLKHGNLKVDMDAANAIGHINTPNGTLDRRPSSIQSVSPTVTITPANVFDSSFTRDTDRTRPTTSHGHDSSAGGNGLRMHPVTNADIPTFTESRLSNGRPKTFSADYPISQETTRSTTLPTRQQSFTSQTSRQPPSFLQSDPSRSVPRPSHTSASAPGSRHSHSVPSSEQSYYGSTIDAQTGGGGGGGGGWGGGDIPASTSSMANTAKRRSTITATPRFSVPPPVPETLSAKSLKSSKRKSFLAAFRRSAAAA